MRFFRLMAILVLGLACVVLGAACAGAKGAEGPHGPKGDNGANGVGVENIVNNGNGTFTVNLTSGESYTTDNLTGPKGDTGAQGIQGVQGIQGNPGMPGVGVEWVGEWDSGTLYAKYDGVGYQGSSYISKQNNNTNHLPTDTNWWDLWVERGDAGLTGADGADGAPGANGQDGAPGPNMIVAAGVISSNGDILQGYNVTSCVWDDAQDEFAIELTGITFDLPNYAVLVTPMAIGGLMTTYTVDVTNYPGRLIVVFIDDQFQLVQAPFSFMVLECP